MNQNLKLIAASEDTKSADGQIFIEFSNDADPRTLALESVARIDLKFPKFTDGRAYSQAYLLRRRLGFKGELRATGDVLVDQLQQMQRCGFDSAVLRADQSLDSARRQMGYFADFYQGDATQPSPKLSSQDTRQGDLT